MARRTPLPYLVAGLLVLALGGIRPARGHADLVASDPAPGVGLASAPERALLRYDQAVRVDGARAELVRSEEHVPVGAPVHASADHTAVAVPLPELGAGSYVLSWFVFSADGDVMAGELPFTVLPAAGAPRAGEPAVGIPGAADRPPGATSGADAAPALAYSPLGWAEAAARLVGFVSLTVLLGGITFVALLWRPGAGVRRTRALLWASLAVALVANTAALGLKGAALTGQSAASAFSPAALGAAGDAHAGRVLLARLGFLMLALPVVAHLTTRPHQVLRSRRWMLGAAASALGVLATHGLLSHASTRGPLATAAHALHLGAVAVWLGGLVVLAAVVLPRRRRDELAALLPRWSRLAFASVATAAAAGTVVLVLLSPRWAALPGSGYGRLLLTKLVLVALLLAVASRARAFVRRRATDVVADTPGSAPAGALVPVAVPAAVGAGPRAVGPLVIPPGAPTPVLPASSGDDSPSLDRAEVRPLVRAVTAEVGIALGVLAATTALVGRSPPT